MATLKPFAQHLKLLIKPSIKPRVIHSTTIFVVHLVFLDDAKQKPTRPGINGNLVSVATLVVAADKAPSVERALHEVCLAAGFPADAEFKWSPSRKSWMHSELVSGDRQEFFRNVAEVLVKGDCFASVVMEDDQRGRATSALTTEQDVMVLLLERVASRLKELGDTGLLIADRPSGGRREEDHFVVECLRLLEAGTEYVQHNELTFVVTADSKSVRLLQAADLVVSCMTAYVAGESTYSPPVVKLLLPLFPTAYGRRAGYSIKIHPSYNFANLHHWLFGESDWVRSQMGTPMPLKGCDYFDGPDSP